MNKSHISQDYDINSNSREALIRILALYNSCRRTGGKNFIRGSENLMKRFRHVAPRTFPAIQQHYNDFMLVMNLLKECLINGVYQVLQTRRVIIEKNDCVFRPGKRYTYEYDDKRDQLSFSIEMKVLDRPSNESHGERIKNDKLDELIFKFYEKLGTTCSSVHLYSDSPDVQDMNYSGVSTFLDFLRLTLIYNHIIYNDFRNIKVCAYNKCSKLFYSKIYGTCRGKYCSNKCYKNDLPKDVEDMRACQRKMRTYYDRLLTKYTDITGNDAFSDIRIVLSDKNCANCKYKNNPRESKKGDCKQITSRTEIMNIVEKIKTSTDSKKSVK